MKTKNKYCRLCGAKKVKALTGLYDETTGKKERTLLCPLHNTIDCIHKHVTSTICTATGVLYCEKCGQEH